MSRDHKATESWVRYFHKGTDEELIALYNSKVQDGTIKHTSPLGNAVITVIKSRGLHIADPVPEEDD